MPIAQYQMGAPQRPRLDHDPGFADCSRAATYADKMILRGWRLALEGAEAAQGVPLVPHNQLPDALAAYRHFLNGAGKPRKFSYDRYVSNDRSGRVTLENAVADLREGIEEIAANNPYLSGVQVTGTGIRCESNGPWSHLFPYPHTENWQKAIGAHWIWLSAVVAVNRGSPRSFVATMTLHAEDLYNFNPGDEDLATGLPDALNGSLEESCLGREYMNVSTLIRLLRWTETAVQNSSVNPDGASRQRNPQDNRRLRNRV
jgi:hypothetical protein